MIKVVYNACFGGFNLSEEAFRRMAKLGHKGAKEALKNPYSFGGEKHYSIDGLDRHDPILVQAVEEIGTEKASGYCSKLAITSISSNRYRISEYDGREGVQEADYDPNDWIEVEND
jgi:hypothetical protein